MDKKNPIIVTLILALGVAVFFAVENTRITQQESSATNAIPPSLELKAAYEESQHSAMADIAEFSCLPTSRFNCGGGSCTPAAPMTYYFVDYGSEIGTYFRCDVNGCDSYRVTANRSGEFTQLVPLQGQATLFVIATGDSLGNTGEFVDVATVGTGTIISSGKCEFRK